MSVTLPTAMAVLSDVVKHSARAEIYLVGGVVRDHLLGREARDVDLVVVSGSSLVLAAQVARLPNWRLASSHSRFGTATIVSPSGIRIDLAAARRETYPEAGALPVVTLEASLQEDLARRDTTIHAMALRLLEDGKLGPLIDPYGGRADLDACSIRLLHVDSLADDPTRLFRAIRYEVRLGFRVAEPIFSEALSRSRTLAAWARISGDRLRNSLDELLREPGWLSGVGRLLELEAFESIVPGWQNAPGPDRSSSRERGAEPEETEDRWKTLLAPSPVAIRRLVADRLRFSRKLRARADVEGRGGR
jgi:tRNA nucleotidyltransferase (CCA-adding enzyme)